MSISGFSSWLRKGLCSLVVLGCVLATAGCGFQLRGSSDASGGLGVLPTTMRKVYIQGDPFSKLVLHLGRGLRASGAKVLPERQAGAAVLRILDQRFSRRVLSVGSDGKVREYELNYTMRFEAVDAAGAELVPAQHISIVRDYLNDEIDVLAKSHEENIIRKEMVQDAVQLLLRRLQARIG